MVGGSETAVLDVVDGLIEQLANVAVVEGVDNGPPGPVAVDQTEVTEKAQLVGHGGLLHIDRGRQLADRAGAVAEPGEDLKPARRCQRLESGGDRLGGVAVQLDGRVVASLHAMAHGVIVAVLSYEDMFM